MRVLEQIWEIYGRICSKWLQPFLAEGIKVLERCHRKPPLLVYPHAAQPRRYYRMADEQSLFEVERVNTYLSQGKWLRHTSSKGQFSFHAQKHNLGVRFRSQWIQLTYSPNGVFQVTSPSASNLLLTFTAGDLTFDALTGLPPSLV